MGIRSSYGVFFDSLGGEFSLTRATNSSIYSAFLIVSAIFGLINGWLLDRYGPRIVFAAMGFFTGLSLIISSQVNSFWQLYLSYSLLLAVGTGGSISLAASAVAKWFRRDQGLAIGIATSGTGLGLVFIAPLAGYLVDTLGWRLSFVVIGTIALLLVTISAMLFRKTPEKPDTESHNTGLPSAKQELRYDRRNLQSGDFNLIQALKTSSFWFIFVLFLLFALCSSLLITHIVPYAIDTGIATVQASAILSVFGGISAFSRMFAGRITDVIGRKIPAVIYLLIGACSVILLIWSHELWMFLLLAATYGICFGGFGVIILVLIVDVFGSRSIGAILGATEIAFSIGSAIGSALGGFVFDHTGSYTLAFALAGMILLVILPLVVFPIKNYNKSF